MGQVLVIEGGPTVELRGSPAQGTRHTVAYGVVAETGESVAVKLEGMPGALARERAALTQLGARHGPVPRLIYGGTARLGDKAFECLVIERRPGSPPTTVAGWRRMGRAYARLADRSETTADLPSSDAVDFGAHHAERIADLGERLSQLAASIPDWATLSSGEVPGSPPLVITHGDPGPGNFLDDGGDGSIVDWEEAQIAPRGLDLARLVFIALLGVGPSGYPAREHQARAAAVATGYHESLREQWQPTRQEWRWWITAAGIQFIHRRRQLGGRPAPWQAAAGVLQLSLSSEDAERDGVYPRPT